jgi:hypothetical protein
VSIAASHVAGRLVGGGDHFARPRGHLAAGTHPADLLRPALGGRRRSIRGRCSARALSLAQGAGWPGEMWPVRVHRPAAGVAPIAPAAAAGRGPLSGSGPHAVHCAPAPHGPTARTRALPVLQGTNPCAEAPCQTADHRREPRAAETCRSRSCAPTTRPRLEALVRSRRSPTLCKIERAGDFSLEVEMISACGYLDDDGVGCSLHGRVRKDGRPAKPDLCSEWPPKNRGLHPGCVFGPRRRG